MSLGVGLGIGWAAMAGSALEGPMRSAVFLVAVCGMLCAYVAGRGRRRPMATATATATAVATANAVAAAQGGQSIVNLTVYAPTATDRALGWTDVAPAVAQLSSDDRFERELTRHGDVDVEDAVEAWLELGQDGVRELSEAPRRQQ